MTDAGIRVSCESRLASRRCPTVPQGATCQGILDNLPLLREAPSVGAIALEISVSGQTVKTRDDVKTQLYLFSLDETRATVNRVFQHLEPPNELINSRNNYEMFLLYNKLAFRLRFLRIRDL